MRKTLRKNQNARYQTASELLEDLKHFRRALEFGEKAEPLNSRVINDLNNERITDAKYAAVTAGRTDMYSGRISSFISEAVSEVKARPAFVFLGVTTLAVLIVAAFFGLSKIASISKTADAFQNMKLAKLTYEGGAANAVTVSPDGKYVAYALRDEGRQSLMVRQVEASAAVQIVPPAEVNYSGLTFTQDGNYIYYTIHEAKNAGILYAIPVLGGNPRKIAEDVDGNVTFSPAGDTIAFVRFRTSLMLADPKGGSQRILANASGGEIRTFTAWNPNGKTIINSVFSSADSLYYLNEVSVEDGTEKRLSASRWLVINGLAWLWDGSGVVFSGRDIDTQFSQIWMLSYPSGETKRITNDFSTYVGLSLTADNKSLLAIKKERLFNIWTSPDGATESVKKITHEEGKDEGTSGIDWTPDGKIVYTVRTADKNDIWIVNADGSGNRQLTFDQGSNYSPTVSPDGRFIVFTSTRAGNQNLWQIDIDGGNPAALTDTEEDEGNPSFAPDGKWILYQRTNADNLTTIWKLNLDGGNPVQLIETESSRPTVSADSKFFACDYGEGKTGDPVKLSIFQIEGGRPLKVLDLPLVVKSRIFRWTTDGKGLIYVNSRDRTHNLWSQPLDNKPPKQLTFFESGQIARFKQDRDGKGFALSRGNESSDVVMMSNFR